MCILVRQACEIGGGSLYDRAQINEVLGYLGGENMWLMPTHTETYAPARPGTAASHRTERGLGVVRRSGLRRTHVSVSIEKEKGVGPLCHSVPEIPC